MSIHEHLPPQARKELKEDGWTKALELARAVQEGWAAVRLGNLVARALTAKRSVRNDCYPTLSEQLFLRQSLVHSVGNKLRVRVKQAFFSISAGECIKTWSTEVSSLRSAADISTSVGEKEYSSSTL
jgi:hypothetical protein